VVLRSAEVLLRTKVLHSVVVLCSAEQSV